MIAALEFFDFVWIAVIVSICTGGYAAYARAIAADTVRLRTVEGKIDLILKELGLEYQGPSTGAGLSDEVKALANDPANKIQAIKLHRDQTGQGLKEAKDAVEAYMDGRG